MLLTILPSGSHDGQERSQPHTLVCDPQNSNLKGPCQRDFIEPMTEHFVAYISNQSKLTGLAWLVVERCPLIARVCRRWMHFSQLLDTVKNPLSAARHKVGSAGFPQI